MKKDRMVRERKLEHYVRLYGDGKLTLARAAREAGVSLWEMMDYARARKVPVQYDLEDLQRDVRTIDEGTVRQLKGDEG